MSEISKSPERHTFQRDAYINRCKEHGKEPDPKIIEMYNSWAADDSFREELEEDLEYALRSTDWILYKARNSDAYAQNIYAAMCNMRWQRLDVFPILKDQYWSCTWRSAGGIVADMLGKGDYIDWYCSGMGGLNGAYDSDSEDFATWQKRTGYVPEGTITDEIRDDFQRLGWIPSEWPEDDV